jgi:hypothetical protein
MIGLIAGVCAAGGGNSCWRPEWLSASRKRLHPGQRPLEVRVVQVAHGSWYTAAGGVAYDVMFSDGRFQYEIAFAGSLWAIHRHGPAIKAQTIAAAQALYRRVHGR